MDRRTLLKAGLATTAGGLLIPATDGLIESAEAAAPRVTKAVARNLATPWGIAFLPNGDALVGERDSGKVHRVRKAGGRHLVGRLRVRSEKANWGESGLLGLALSPMATMLVATRPAPITAEVLSPSFSSRQQIWSR